MTETTADKESRPHIVLLLTDHFRADCMGFLGLMPVETPHLDSMAGESYVFRRAYTPCPSCIPARRCLMTGMTPYSAGMVGYEEGAPWDYAHTLAGEITRAGCQSFNVGKTHFHPRRLHLGFENLVTPEDYEEWLALETRGRVGKFDHGVPRNSWMGRPSHLPETMSEEHFLTTEAIGFLNKRDTTRPFFMCLSFNGPHPPWCPPQSFFDMYAGMEMPPPVVGDWAEKHGIESPAPDVNMWRGRITDRQMQRARASFFAYISFLDAEIGRFIDYLKREDLWNNTLFLFTSDHGEMLGDHHLWRKTYAYEGSARVPFVLKPPAKSKPGEVSYRDQPVGWEDIMPTLVEAAGGDIPESVEGRSVLPLLSEENSAWRTYYHGEHAPTYAAENAMQFLTDGKEKYIWNPVTGEEQLFNLDDDPYEKVDLAKDAANRERVERWRSLMVKELEGREDNLSDGVKLICGSPPAVRGGQPGEFHAG